MVNVIVVAMLLLPSLSCNACCFTLRRLFEKKVNFEEEKPAGDRNFIQILTNIR